MDDINTQDLQILLDNELKTKGYFAHHIDSINQFYSTGINQIATHGFVIETTIKNQRTKTEEDKEISSIHVLVTVTNTYLSNPTITQSSTGRQEILTPNRALRENLTYMAPLYFDANIKATAYLKDGTTKVREENVEKYRVANIPVMVMSQFCNAANKTKQMLKLMQHDHTDPGGYFIIKGNEWAVDNVENLTFNQPHIYKNIGHKDEICHLDFISKPGDGFENSAELKIKLLTNNNIVCEITYSKISNVSIPFYLLFRALGVKSDKEIIDNIIYTREGEISNHMQIILDKAFNSTYKVLNGGLNKRNYGDVISFLATEIAALNTNFTNKDDNTLKYFNNNIINVLDKWLFPHIGTAPDSRHKKIRYLGYLINKILLVEYDILESTDRDSYKNKRIHSTGTSMSKIFKKFYNFNVVMQLKKHYNKDFTTMTFSHVPLTQTFKTSVNEADFEKALIQSIITGDKTIEIKKRQVPNRLSSQQLHRKNVLNVLSVGRQVNIGNTSSSKQSERADEMRRAHSSYAGYVCFVQSPVTGEGVGMKKQMAMSSSICSASSSESLKNTVMQVNTLIKLDNITAVEIGMYKNIFKVFVNGDWLGVVEDGFQFVRFMRFLRRNKEIDPYATIYLDVMVSEIYMWVDVGRITRPLLIVYNSRTDYSEFERFSDNFDIAKLVKNSIKNIANDKSSFNQFVNIAKKDISDLITGTITIKDLHDRQVIEYITPEEHENCFIAVNIDELKKAKNNQDVIYTHCEIEQAIVGIPCLTSPYANHNQSTRIIYQTNQVKQACGWYAMNYPYRTERDAVIQYYCDNPIVKTLANNYISPIGSLSMVAIQCYSGYNQEDSIIVNDSAVDRSLFDLCYFTYESSDLEKDDIFTTPNINETMDIKGYADYSKLVDGVVPKGTIVRKNDVLIGKVSRLPKMQQDVDQYNFIDRSVVYKFDEESVVYNIVKGKNSEEVPFIKVILRSKRKVKLGDKFSSRSGQKGVCGIKLRHSDMPFTSNGIVPDLIMNPHAVPSRMTIGQNIEGVQSKLNALIGIITDGTVFNKVDVTAIGDKLEKLGYNRGGTEKMFDGRTGEWIDVEIFITPTYYQRLQKFTTDAVFAVMNAPTCAITRQPISGKSSGGGLRIGEMEKDVLCAHGAMRILDNKFYRDSDGFNIYICRNCRKQAIYNKEQEIYKCNTETCKGNEEIVEVRSSWSVKLFYDELNAMNIDTEMKLQPFVYETN